MLDFVQLFCVGPGSSFFHGTLTFIGQLCDELGMMITTTIWVYCVFTVTSRSVLFERCFALVLTVAILFYISISPKLHFEHNLIFELTFAVATFFCVVRILHLASLSKSKKTKQSALLYFSWMIFGIALWLLDLHFCSFLQSTGLYFLKFGIIFVFCCFCFQN